jgi:hypothetical protein
VAYLPTTNPSLVNGSVTESNFVFQAGGGSTFTITVTDTTSTNIPAATSTPVVVN